MSGGHEGNGVLPNAPPIRKTSVIWDPDATVVQPIRKTSVKNLQGYDNPSYESTRSRKLSSTSSHSEVGPVRKKSILHNSTYVVDTINGNLILFILKVFMIRYVNMLMYRMFKNKSALFLNLVLLKASNLVKLIFTSVLLNKNEDSIKTKDKP